MRNAPRGFNNRSIASVPGEQLDPAAQNVIKLTLAFTKAVGASQDDKSDNLVVSPYNAVAALSMAAKGAEGQTRDEMAQALFGVTGKDLDAAVTGYTGLNTRVLDSSKGQVELTTANGVWTNDRLVQLDAGFAESLRKEFGAEISGETFSPATVDKINGWASKNTRGLIDKVLDKLDPDAAAVLASALYFKGKWTKPFDKALTEEKTFTADDKSASSTPTMHQDYGRKDGLSFVKADGFEAVALTYGEKDAAKGKTPPTRIVLVRPTDDQLSARDWLATQADGKVPQWLDPALFEAATGSVELPRLDIKQTHDLIPALKEMGISQAFKAGAADFSRMAVEGGKELSIGKVSHDTVFKTDEEGSEAAAVTVVGMMRSAAIFEPLPHIDLKLDRSFVFALQDVDTGAVLFLGAVNKPNNDMKAGAAPAKPATGVRRGGLR